MGNTNVMLVDDEERFLLTTKKMLEKKGYKVQTASSGTEALEKLEKNNIHVVILDVKMPGMDGIITLKRMKKEFPQVEVIMLTGHATVETAIDGMKLGAYDFLLKPCETEELISKINNAYEKKREHEERIRAAKVKEIISSPRSVLSE